MNSFNYISGFILLFTAIALGEMTTGLAYSINGYNDTVFYLPHSLLIVTGYLGSFDYIMRIYNLRKHSNWDYWKFVLAVSPGICYLIIAKLLFPDIDPPDNYNFYLIWKANSSLIFTLTILYYIGLNATIAILHGIRNRKLVLINFVTLFIFLLAAVLKNDIMDHIASISAVMAAAGVNLLYSLKIKEETSSENLKL